MKPQELVNNIVNEYNGRTGDISKVGETYVCNLGSPNLAKHITNYGAIDWALLAKTVLTMTEMLDNVINLNYYPIESCKIANQKNRPIGLGLMGFHDALRLLNMDYDSDECAKLSCNIQELIYYYSISKSVELAKKNGPYPNYEGSEWSKGNLHHEIWSSHFTSECRSWLHWESLKQEIANYGVRNSVLLSIAPNASSADILGTSPSIEPDYSCLYVKSTMSGEFMYLNPYFEKDMKKLGLWSKEAVDIIVKANGDLSIIDGIPDVIKHKYRTVFQLNFYKIIDCAAARQKYIDMGQSFNIYYNSDSLKDLLNIYMYCCKKGLKTTYYLRTLGAGKSKMDNLNKENEQLKSLYIYNRWKRRKQLLQQAYLQTTILR
jgi:ribonucleoside-diphosphate reductase alpha chain